MKRSIIALASALGISAGVLATAGAASAATAAANQDRISIAYVCSPSTTTYNWKITVSGPVTAWTQFYNYAGGTPYKAGAYNLKPGTYSSYKTYRRNGVGVFYHDLGSGNPNLWVHVTATSPHPCPLTFSGNGDFDSGPFTVGSQVKVTYSFNCANFGIAGNFIGDLIYGSDTNFADDQNFANALSTSGSATSYAYPAFPGHSYHLSIISECDWKVTLIP